MSSSPQVSVVIPVYNGERFLADAIHSVLAQQVSAVEILVVDDGSTDGTAGVARSFGDRVQLIQQSNAGAAAARNRGIQQARADMVAFLDTDDQYTPDKFSLQVDRLERYPAVEIVIGQNRYLMIDGQDADGPRFTDYPDEHLSLQFGCGLFRRSVFDRIGPLAESMRLCEDWDWFMRAREASVPLLLHRHVVLHQRIHTQNVTRQREAGARFTLDMVRRSLARRRAGNAAPVSLPPLSAFFEPEDPAE
jgi:glycosyltransferase involved in cell wall biosynthesis